MRYDGGIFKVVEAEGRIVGFVAGYMDPARFYRRMSEHKWRLGMRAILRTVVRPSLLVPHAGQCPLGDAAAARERAARGMLRALSIGVLPGQSGNASARRWFAHSSPKAGGAGRIRSVSQRTL